ncbi:primase-helicase zinc-binding domain-containing protein [Aureimonas ureilytica]|uniref:primase-helicase zinc-binding domain-containing protein n=1 Tax=Aureimonas ureilytica TaxID=401562 RepID=UPI0003A65D4F|nr:primase-helicase zinc-binding domain-containing protein [Aureimonas ureilytica]
MSVTGEHVGPCPVCGGRDRFQVNPTKNAWLCRGAAQGKDAIGLAAHVLGLDLARASDFLEACAAVSGRPVPDGHEEDPTEAAARAERLAARRRENEAKAAKRDRDANIYRERQQQLARGKWLNAQPEGLHSIYLARRLDRYARDLPVTPFLRTSMVETYWHGEDERDPRGVPVELFTGPAMVAPFVLPSGEIVGCHLTWIDLTRRPKFRPVLRDPKTPRGEALPTKKMRGTKKGGMIPLIGFYELDGLILPDPHRTRFVSGEGIENTIAAALGDGVRADTIYAAAGDLGNLAGPADPASRITHPTLKKPNRNGVPRAVFVKGAVPKPDQSPADAMQVPPWITEILLVADGDSEQVSTVSDMQRAKTRLQSGGALVDVAWPPEGMDFADILALTPHGH